MTKEELNKYINYIASHTDEIAKVVNEFFEKKKDFLRNEVLKELKEYIHSDMPRYIHEADNNPYDHSGILIKVGTIDLNETIKCFLNEYSGQKEATFESNYGWIYRCHDDEFRDISLSLAFSILYEGIETHLNKYFNIVFYGDDFMSICERFYNFDDIYAESIAYDFFFFSNLVEFVGVENMKLKDVQEMKF